MSGRRRKPSGIGSLVACLKSFISRVELSVSSRPSPLSSSSSEAAERVSSLLRLRSSYSAFRVAAAEFPVFTAGAVC